MGRTQYGDKLVMQLDPGGAYNSSVSKRQGSKRKWKHTARLVKLRWLRQRRVWWPCRHRCVQGSGVPPAKQGTDLPWHQDGVDWWGLDRSCLALINSESSPNGTHAFEGPL